ncbi:MAG: molybdopterin dinucleotide binding domain-containing protein [Thermodesulfobacteriota bacterium]|nr:molybdopterin dinucleotide binding domain-containing protein [Thermodesulfobacteriota bacterium]
MTAWTADPGKGVPAKDQYIDGLMCWGQNPAVGGASCDFERRALANLSWLVCVDLWETETAAFWKPDGLGGTLGIPGRAPGSINTEVFLLPAAASYEKEGSIVNSGRWSQWRYKALPPPGQALDDLSIINKLGKKLIALYQGDPAGPLSDPVAKLHWGFYPGTDAHGKNGSSPNGYDDPLNPGHADPHRVAWEMNGYFCPSAGGGATPGARVDGFWGPTAATQTLRENGETSSGNWLYCSHYINPIGGGGGNTDATAPNGNRQERRDPTDNSGSGIGLYSGWSYCWPLNRRIIYNGASVYQPGHPNVGKPLAPSKYVISYSAGGTVLDPGCDVPDGYKPPGSAGNRYPFIMHREGVAHLFGPGRADGPFPEHYEPWETVLTSNIISQTLTSPTNFGHVRPEAYEHPGHGNPDFPIVGTTYRLSEHWQAGQMTRNLPFQCELQPDAFVELSEELATILGISNGDMVEIKTQRTELYGQRMEAVACVTNRFKPYTIAGGTVHHIGAIWHFGYTGCCTGHSANLCTAHIGDANTGIPESKAFICNMRKLPDGLFLS